jgi:hypothetical protein
MTRPDVGHAWSDGTAEPVFRTLEILANRAVVNEFVNETRRNSRVMSLNCPTALHANRSGTLNESLSSLAASGFIPP